jgi:hypothetical protein
MLQLFVVIFDSGVEYQSCLEFCDDHAFQISAIMHFPMESYPISYPILAAVQTTRQGWEKGAFRAIERRNFIMR